MTVVAPSPTRRTPGGARRLAVGAVVSLLVLTACSDQATSPGRTDIAGDTPTTQSAQPDAEAPDSSPDTGPTASAAEPSASTPVLGRRTPGLGQRLLPPKQLPVISSRTRWSREQASDKRQRRHALCHPFSLTAAGAERVRARRYVDAAAQDRPARAAQLLAAFPDRATTRRAGAVLGSWHDQCEDRLGERKHRVAVGEPVVVEGLPGPASWYRTRITAKPGAVPLVEITGRVQVGSRIGVVVLRHRKGSYAPQVGPEQVETALRRTAEALS